MRRHYFYVEDDVSRVYFDEDEIKQANKTAQQLANELRRPVARCDADGGKLLFYPGY